MRLAGQVYLHGVLSQASSIWTSGPAQMHLIDLEQGMKAPTIECLSYQTNQEWRDVIGRGTPSPIARCVRRRKPILYGISHGLIITITGRECC